MSLPLLIIFERHWDAIPKHTVKEILPELAELGYDTYCMEAPHNWSSKDLVEQHKMGLKGDQELYDTAVDHLKRSGVVKENLCEESFGSLAHLMMLYVSSKRYQTVAEKIRALPSSRLLKAIFEDAEKLSISAKGVDIVEDDYSEMLEVETSQRMKGIKARETKRITSFVSNITALRERGHGVVFACGALHADNVLAELEKKGLSAEVAYYFPHSTKRLDETVDDIAVLFSKCKTLLHHSHQLSESEVKSFGKKVIKEIRSKIKYEVEILEGTTHSKFLSQLFNTTFRAFWRNGYYVDALVDMSNCQKSGEISSQMQERGVTTYSTTIKQHSYLVVPGINTSSVLQKIYPY